MGLETDAGGFFCQYKLPCPEATDMDVPVQRRSDYLARSPARTSASRRDSCPARAVRPTTARTRARTTSAVQRSRRRATRNGNQRAERLFYKLTGEAERTPKRVQGRFHFDFHWI